MARAHHRLKDPEIDVPQTSQSLNGSSLSRGNTHLRVSPGRIHFSVLAKMYLMNGGAKMGGLVQATARLFVGINSLANPAFIAFKQDLGGVDVDNISQCG